MPSTAQHGAKAYHLDVGVGVVVAKGSQGEQEGSHGRLRMTPAADQQAHLDAPLVGSPPQPIINGRPKPWGGVQGTESGLSTSLTLSFTERGLGPASALRAPKP